MNDKTKMIMMQQRELLKGYHSSDAGMEPSDQSQGLPQPPVFCSSGNGKTIPLTQDFSEIVNDLSITALFAKRSSHRNYLAATPLTLEELSFLLWATQGVRGLAGPDSNRFSLRQVPSAGSRHPLETWLFINEVENLEQGLYHYDPKAHTLELMDQIPQQEKAVAEALCGQKFAGYAPVIFVWSAVPYRSEWRYAQKAHKYILLDAGHVCENLYLACEAIGCGTCAIGAYDQDLLDELLGLPPGPSVEQDYSCAVYAASVGHISK